MTLMPNEIMSEVKKFNSLSELKEWMTSLGFDLNPDYTGLRDEMEHSNYQMHFYLDILHSEINKLSPDAEAIIIFNNNNEEVLADDLDRSHYSSFTNYMDSHTLLNQ